MKVEINCLYKSRPSAAYWQKDDSMSTPEHEVSDEVAKQFMQLLELKKWISKVLRDDKISYFEINNSINATEYIFRK